MILKSTWTRLNSQLSLIKNCLGFRWCKDPRWPHSQLWLQMGSASPPSLLILKVFPPWQPVCWSAQILSSSQAGGGQVYNSIKYTNTLCSLSAPPRASVSPAAAKFEQRAGGGWKQQQQINPAAKTPRRKGERSKESPGRLCISQLFAGAFCSPSTALASPCVHLCPREEHPSRRKKKTNKIHQQLFFAGEREKGV